jgi:integrase
VSVYALRHLRDDRHRSTRAAPVLNEWLAYLDVEGKAGGTLYNYERRIGALLRENDLHLAEFTPEIINSYLATVPHGSRHIARSIINKFFEWAELHDKIDRSPMGRVARVKHPERRAINTFTDAEVALLEALPSPDGQLFAILFGSGLRKAEARKLRRDDIDIDRRRLVVRQGKGGKDRIVALTPSAVQAVADLDLIEGLAPEDHLWGCRPGGGKKVSRRFAIGDSTFSTWYAACIDAARVRYLSPHKCRHTYHELLRRFGLDLEKRQVLMGHKSSRTTTDQYGHVSIDEVVDDLADFELGRL